jgi:phosphate transport system protein
MADIEARKHTVRAFDEDLADLSGKLMAMGGIVERQLANAIHSLVERDTEGAERVIRDDLEVDRIEEQADELAVRVLATRQPMAVDLRTVAMALKISNDLERIGDYATNIAKRARRINTHDPIKPFITIPLMAEICRAMVKDVLDAYVERDAQKALKVWSRDPEVDEYYDQLFRELVTYILEDPKLTGACVDLMFVAKNLERIGDHATNIAEKVYYIVHGDQLSRARSAAP